LFLQVVILDVSPDEPDNLASWAHGSPDDGLQVRADIEFFGNLFPSRMYCPVKLTQICWF
jgi:hypothetical protein